MSAAEFSHELDEHLEAVLTPEGAPSDEDIAGEFTFEADADEATERVSAWRPEDEGAADWVGRKALRAAQQLAAKQAQRDRLVAQADAWLAKERKRLDSTIAWAEAVLADWLRREIESDPRGKKSRELPCGVTVKRTGGRASLVVEDEDALVAWLAQFTDLAVPETVWKWSKAEVKKAFEATDPDELGISKLIAEGGEQVPGAHIETGPDSYRLDIPGGA